MVDVIKNVKLYMNGQTIAILTFVVILGTGRRSYKVFNHQKENKLLEESKAKNQELAFCDFCVAAGSESDNNAFLKGCSNIKLHSIKCHEIANGHVFATKKHINAQKP